MTLMNAFGRFLFRLGTNVKRKFMCAIPHTHGEQIEEKLNKKGKML